MHNGHEKSENVHIAVSRLAELGVCNPVCSLIRSKAGISLYRVMAEGNRFVLKIFKEEEDAREIKNYQILSSLGIPTLPLLGYTENAVLLPDVKASRECSLVREDDLSNSHVARAIARWYRALHAKGKEYLSGRETSMYDESDVITEEWLDSETVAERRTEQVGVLTVHGAGSFERII